MKYPSWKEWLFGGQWEIPNGGVICWPLWRRLYYRWIWSFQRRVRFAWYRRFGYPNSMTGAQSESKK